MLEECEHPWFRLLVVAEWGLENCSFCVLTLPVALAVSNGITERLDVSKKKSSARDVLTVELFLHAVKPPPERAKPFQNGNGSCGVL